MKVNVYEAKTHLSQLIDKAAAGEEIVIARNGRPVAKLVPITAGMEPRKLGSMRGLIHVPDDFDDPDPEFEDLFYGDGTV